MTKIIVVVFYFVNLFVAGTSTSTVASAAPILSIASEQRRLFGYASASTRPSTRPSARTVNRKPKGKNTCTLKFVCLSSKNASTPPFLFQDVPLRHVMSFHQADCQSLLCW